MQELPETAPIEQKHYAHYSDTFHTNLKREVLQQH